MEYKRSYKEILKVQLEYIDIVTQNILKALQLGIYDEDYIVNHVDKYLNCDIEEDWIRVNWGEMYGYVTYTGEKKGFIWFDMSEAGLSSSDYVSLVRELDSLSEDKLSEAEFYPCYDTDMKSKNPYVLCYNTIFNNSSILCKTSK